MNGDTFWLRYRTPDDRWKYIGFGFRIETGAERTTNVHVFDIIQQVVLPLAIDLSACFIPFTTGGPPSDRATGFVDRPTIIVRSRAVEVVLSKEAKYHLHLPPISSSFRRSFPSSFLVYCALPTLLPCKFHPPEFSVPAVHVPSFDERFEIVGVHRQIPVLCGLHDLPELSAYLPQRAKSRATGKGTAHRCLSLFPLRPDFFKFGVRTALSSNNPVVRQDCRIRPGMTSSADSRSVLLEKRAAFSPTVPQSSACVSATSGISRSRRSVSDVIGRLLIV